MKPNSEHIPISPVDMFFVNGHYPIEFVLFYPYRIHTKPLRKALKKIAALFWPAFGYYANGEIKAFPKGKEGKEAEDGWWGEETIATEFDPTKNYETLHREFGTEHLKSLQHLQTITSNPRLFHFKLIHFTNGTMLIPTLNHLAGDGYSYFYLLSVLAALYRQRKLPFASLVLGKLFRPRHIRTKRKFQIPKDEMEGYLPEESLAVEFTAFNKTDIRQKALRASEQSGLPVSTNDILCAIEAKSVLDSHSSENLSNFNLVIPIDVRRGVPEYGQKFFGNGIMVLKTPLQSADVSNASLETIAIQIRKSFPAVSTASFESFNDSIIQWIDAGDYGKLLPYNPETDCLVTNLSRIPLKALNFGNGMPSLVAPTTIGKGSTLVLSNKDSYILRRVR
ncbi:MAG: acyltransferase [Promethearchaeota archaeon]